MTARAALLVAAALAIAACGSGEPESQSEPLVVGLTGKYPPLNYTDQSGELTGFDVDFAKEVCRELERRCEFRILQWDGILGALLAGRIDVVIGSMAITEARAKEVRFSRPYYKSGAQLFVPRGRPAPQGQSATIGVTLGTTYEAAVRERYPSADVRTYKGDTEILSDMTTGRLDGMVTDRLVGAYMAKKFGVDLVPEGGLLYEEKIAIPVAPEREALLREVDDAVQNIRASDRYDEMLAKHFGEEVVETRSETSVLDGATIQLLLKGLWATLRVCFAGIGLGLIWGVVAAVALLGLKPVRIVLSTAIDFIRATPFMVQLFAIYFGLPAVGIRLGAFTSAVLAMALHSSAYLAEVIKVTYLAVPSGQHVAARALGLTRFESLRYVALPQMLPSLTVPTLNTVVAMVKDSAVVSVIGVYELTLQSQQLIGATFRPMTFYAIAALLYFAVTYPMLLAGRALERRYQRRGLLGA